MKTKSKLEEKKLSKAELEAREKVIKDLKKNKSALVKRYGKDAEAVMYGRATNIAKKMAESENKNRIKELVRKALMQEADIEVMADKYGEEKALGQAAMMLDALEELLKKHDWWYMMSDDNRAYTQGSAQQYEIRKIMKELEAIGYGKDAKTLFNQYAPDGPGGSTQKMKEGVDVATEMTTQEASGHAERFAKYMSDKEGHTFTVTAGSVDGPSFDLDYDGIKYDGGSYIISKTGDIINMALPNNPVYANITMLEGKKEDMDKDGDIDSKDYLLKRDAAIQKAKGEIKEEELEEAYVPSNIKEFAKRKGATSLVNKVAGWAEKAGKGIRGGTAIGKDYSTLVLDLGYQDGAIRINLDNDTVELYGEEVFDAKSFKQVYLDSQEESKDSEMNEANMFVTGGSINPELRKKVEQFVKGVAKYYDYSVDDAFLAIMTILKGGIAKEGVNEDIDLGHQDNEPHMIKGDLYQIGKYAMELYAVLEEIEETNQEVDFPAWWQSKITVAKENMDGAKHYLEFELAEPAVDAFIDKATGEEPHEGEPEAPMMEAEIGKDEILAGKIMKALKAMINKDASDQHNLKQARIALNKGNIDAAEKIAKPYMEEGLPKGFWNKNMKAKDEIKESSSKIKDILSKIGDIEEKIYDQYSDDEIDAKFNYSKAIDDIKKKYKNDENKMYDALVSHLSKLKSSFPLKESYETLVKKIKGQGESTKAAKAIAGAVAAYKAKGGGKGPTAKQSK
jgi:hypothetical protein